LWQRDWAQIILERFREDPAAALLIEPFELGAPECEDAAEHELGRPLRMRLGIGKRKRRAPGAAKHLPALDVEELAELLDVVNEMPGGVFVDARMRRGAPAAPLVEQHDAVTRRIVIAAHHGGGASAGAAMQQHGGLAVRIAAFLEVKLMQRGNLESSRAVGDDLGEEAQALPGGCLTLIHAVAILHDGAPVGE